MNAKRAGNVLCVHVTMDAMCILILGGTVAMLDTLTCIFQVLYAEHDSHASLPPPEAQEPLVGEQALWRGIGLVREGR